MSGVAQRGLAMVHRADISRNITVGENELGQPVQQLQAIGEELACLIWATTEYIALDGQKVAFITSYKGIFPPDANIQDDDIITAVLDRRGVQAVPTPKGLRVTAAIPAIDQSYISLSMEQIT